MAGPFLSAVWFALEFHFLRRARLYTSIVLMLVGIVAYTLLVPPLSFPSRAYLVIDEGMTVGEIASHLESEGYIQSALWFKGLARISLGGEALRSGSYVFDHPIGLLELFWRIHEGISGIETVRITIPEGYTTYQMAEVFASSLPLFDAELFLRTTKSKEGYLFPDTYEFPKDSTAEVVEKRMTETFDVKTKSLEPLFETFPEPRTDVVIMASLLEREANTTQDRRMIADILWRRLDEGMALQVDAVFGYIAQRETYHPSFEDLEIDSPYNTYKHRGLPPTPIANPGLDALTSALTPLPNEYWYYLTDADGIMHYARTFEEHKKNRLEFLQ